MKITFLDFETSGLVENHSTPLDKQPSAIELYMCEIDMETGEMLREFESLFKPKRPVSDEITRITSIDNDMLKDAPSFEEKAYEIVCFLEVADLIVAHNASFDKEMIEIELERLGRKIHWPIVLCSVEATAFYKGYRLNLMALHEHLFKERFAEAHRAKTDVQALTRCVCEMVKRGDI